MPVMKKLLTTTATLFLASSLNVQAMDMDMELPIFREKQNPEKSEATATISIDNGGELETIISKVEGKTMAKGNYVYKKRGEDVSYKVNDKTYSLKPEEMPIIKVIEQILTKIKEDGIRSMPECTYFDDVLWKITGEPGTPEKMFQDIKVCKYGTHEIAGKKYTLIRINAKDDEPLPAPSFTEFVSMSAFIDENIETPWIHTELNDWVDYTSFDKKLEKEGVYNHDFARICQAETGTKIKAYVPKAIRNK